MPERACYLTALKALHLPAGEVAFVGHDAAELAGAAAAGMPTIAFNFDADARADVYLARFEELLEVIHPRPLLAAAG
jgi:FMN phosphatase YigB (HAD superfamily)